MLILFCLNSRHREVVCAITSIKELLRSYSYQTKFPSNLTTNLALYIYMCVCVCVCVCVCGRGKWLEKEGKCDTQKWDWRNWIKRIKKISIYILLFWYILIWCKTCEDILTWLHRILDSDFNLHILSILKNVNNGTNTEQKFWHLLRCLQSNTLATKPQGLSPHFDS